MPSALIQHKLSYPALQLVSKLVDQRFAQPGPLVTYSPISRSADYTFTRLRRFVGVREVASYLYRPSFSYGMIRCCTSPSIFQLKSLRGQTKRSKQFFSCFFLLHLFHRAPSWAAATSFSRKVSLLFSSPIWTVEPWLII